MSLTPTHLSALQQAGAAVFTADAELKNAVQAYAERVTAAMQANPFGLGNDALFENWKRVARLSQTVAGIEEELKKVFFMAEELMGEDTPAVQSVPTLAAPVAEAPVPAPAEDQLAPTDVRIKSTRKTARKAAAPVAKSAKPAKPANAPVMANATVNTTAAAKPAASKAASAAPAALGGNAGKLLQHLQGLLNTQEFLPFNQSASALVTGIPLGSMTAALRKLTDMGRLSAGPGGRFKLMVAR
jgi:hypothetical protein